MKILHIIKREPGPAALSVINAHREVHDVTVTDLREGFSPEALLDAVEEADRVFCW